MPSTSSSGPSQSLAPHGRETGERAGRYRAWPEPTGSRCGSAVRNSREPEGGRSQGAVADPDHRAEVRGPAAGDLRALGKCARLICMDSRHRAVKGCPYLTQLGTVALGHPVPALGPDRVKTRISELIRCEGGSLKPSGASAAMIGIKKGPGGSGVVTRIRRVGGEGGGWAPAILRAKRAVRPATWP
jgi:hypothetical protein